MADEPRDQRRRDSDEPRGRPERDWRSVLIWILAVIILAAAVYLLIGFIFRTPARERTPTPDEMTAAPHFLATAKEKHPPLRAGAFAVSRGG